MITNDDIDKMAEEGLIPDVCNYGNLFFDSEVVFSFIDVKKTFYFGNLINV